MKRGQPIRNELIECPLCPLTFVKDFSTWDFAWHLSSVHEIEMCPHCGDSFRYSSNWNYHVADHLYAIITALHAQLLGVDPHEK